MNRPFIARLAVRCAIVLPFSLLFACSAGTGADTGEGSDELKLGDAGHEDGGSKDGGGFADGGKSDGGASHDAGGDGGDGGHHADGGRDGGSVDAGDSDGGEEDGGECDAGEDGGEEDAGYACLQYAIVEINDTCNETDSSKATAEASCADEGLAFSDWTTTRGSCPSGTFSEATYACCGAGVTPIHN